jgi:hypothetical protein
MPGFVGFAGYSSDGRLPCAKPRQVLATGSCRLAAIEMLADHDRLLMVMATTQPKSMGKTSPNPMTKS